MEYAANDTLVVTTGGSLLQLDAETGASLSAPVGGYYYPPLLHVSPDGTKVYTRVLGLSGGLSSIDEWDVTGTQPVLTRGYSCYMSNSEDYTVDATARRIYTADGGIYGVGVSNMDTNAVTTWSFGGAPYGRAVAELPGGAYVYGGSGTDAIYEFGQNTGIITNKYLYNGNYAIINDALKITPNGHLLYAANYFTGTGAGYKYQLASIGTSSLVIENVPVARFTANVGRAGSPTTFDATSSEAYKAGQTITAYAWTFGDGSAGSGATPSHIYAQAGTYTVKLTVTSSTGLTDDYSAQINVPPAAPLANAGGPYSVNEGTPAGAPSGLTLTGSGSSPSGLALTYEWDLNYDGVTFHPMATGASVPFSAVGLDGPSTRTVALRVTDSSNGSTIATATVSILNVPPTLSASGDAQVFTGSTYTLNLASSDPGLDTISSWTINWGDGGPAQLVSGNPASITHSYSKAGHYTITTGATDEDGSYTGPSQNVTAIAAPALAADGTLNVEGSDAADTIDVSLVPGASPQPLLLVTVDGLTRSFAAAAVQRISLQARAGDDTVTLGGGVPIAGTIDLGDGNDSLTIGTPASGSGPLFVFGGNGDDALTLTTPPAAPLTFDGGSGNDTFTFNGSDAPVPEVLDVRAGSITTSASANGRADYFNVESVNLKSTAGDDVIRVHGGANSATALAIDGGDGNDTLQLSTDGLTGMQLNTTSPTAGIYSFSNAQPVSYANVEQAVAVPATTVANAGISIDTGGGGLASLTFTFSEAVFPTIGAAGITVVNQATAASVTPSTYAYDAATHTVTLTFAAGLPAGAYRATIAASAFPDFFGQPLDGNADGVSGDDFTFDFTPSPAAAPAPAADSGWAVHLVLPAVATPSAGSQPNTLTIERLAPGGSWTPIATLPAGTQGFDDTSLAPGTLYQYRVRQCIDGVCSAWSALTSAMTFLPGDVNGDYQIDFFDISALLATKYNTGQPATWAEGDQNGDGIVDFFDLTEILAGHYNTGPYWTPPPVTAPAPVAVAAASAEAVAAAPPATVQAPVAILSSGSIPGETAPTAPTPSPFWLPPTPVPQKPLRHRRTWWAD
jgi:PKD repeat protein